jgi:hypothetical protein
MCVFCVLGGGVLIETEYAGSNADIATADAFDYSA